MELNEKLLEKAKDAKNAEELVAIAKENGIELTAEEAKSYFAKLNSKTGELNDDELDNVAGGRKCGTIYYDDCPVVSDLNGCEHYYNSYNGNRGDGYCKYCTYSHWEGMLMVCKCPARRNN